MRTYLFFLALFISCPPLFGQSSAFVPNQGQVADANGKLRPDILYTAAFPGADLFFFRDGFSYVLWEEKNTGLLDEGERPISQRRSHRVDIRWIGTNDQAILTGDRPTEGHSHYYYTHCPEGVLDVPAFSVLTIQDLYPGIDVVFSARENGLEYDFHLRPGADLSQVQYRIEGADSLLLVDEILQMHTSLGNIEEFIPLAYLAGTGTPIPCSYALEGKTLRFQTEPYSTQSTLIIDPVSTWATYYGGSGIDYGRGVAWNGFVYQSGETASNNFPITPGVQQTVFGGNRDAYLIQWNMAGNRLWSTYFGGTTLDAAEDVAVTPAGNILVAGYTSGAFPVSGSAFQATYGGNTDGFLTQFSPAGLMMWSTYVGGEEQDRILDVASDGLGNAVVGGFTSSSFQISTPGVAQVSRAGNADAFVVKFDPSGNRLWGTYWGGSGLDEAHGIATDGNQNIVIAGRTYGPFPTGATAGNVVAQSVKAGGFGDMDIFATKFSPSGARLWSTYYGGPNVERGYDVAVDGADNVIVAGNAWASFPVTPGVSQTIYGGGSGDASVVKFAPNGARLFATYLGGSTYDLALSVDAVGTNDIIVGGETNKPFPTVNFCQNTCAGTYCGFLVHLNGTGSSRLMSTLLGGSGTFNSVVDVAVDGSSNIFATGFTSSTNYPVGGTTVFQNTFGGGSADAFMGIYNDDSCRAVILDAFSIQLSGQWLENEIQLDWQTSEACNEGQFVLERWLGEDHFETSATLIANGGSHYRQTLPSDPFTGSTWFRIRYLDRNGAEILSPFVEVSPATADWSFTLYPNPANGAASVRYSQDAEAGQLHLVDLTGRTIGQFPLGISGGEVDFSAIPAGVYLVKLEAGRRNGAQLLRIAR